MTRFNKAGYLNSTSVRLGSWVAEFLQQRGLSHPDERPLFQYHVSNSEYLELESLIRSNRESQLYYRNSANCAAFCLYCAEWYRRKYEKSDGWSWDGIWQALGFSFNSIDIAKIVPIGLQKYWRRPMRLYDANRRNLIGSLFGEGGLPFRLIADSNSRFYALFQDILKEQGEWKSLGFSTADQVEVLVGKRNLPAAFKDPTSTQLIAAMADQLMLLASNYELSNYENPAQRLDILQRQWRDSFPIPLDETTGTELLNNLLLTASKETQKRVITAAKWQCEHSLNYAEKTFSSKISLPATLEIELSAAPSSPRLELFVSERGVHIGSFGVAYASVDGVQVKLRPRINTRIVKRSAVQAELSLVVVSGGAVVGSIEIANSAIPLGEVPVGFEQIEARWLWSGQASFATASRDVLLILPEKSVCLCEEGEATDGPLIGEFKTQHLVGETVSTVLCEECFVVKTGRDNSKQSNIGLVGSLCEWPTKPALTFVGAPSPKCLVGAGELLALDNRLYVSGNPCRSSSLLGTHFVSVRSTGGDALLRRKIGILPADFQIELSQGSSANSGLVRVKTRTSCQFTVKQKEVSVERKDSSGSVELQVQCQSVPPQSFELSVLPEGATDPVIVELPFPSSGSLVFDRSGEPIAQHCELSELLGARAVLLPFKNQMTLFEIELTLRGRAARNARYAWSHRVQSKPLEIDLYSLKRDILSLMSLDPGIDQTVEMLIKGPMRVDSYHFNRHSMALSTCRDADRVLEMKGSFSVADSVINPQAILLRNPEQRTLDIPTKSSQGVDVGLYELPSILDQDGPWLIVPNKLSDTYFRPFYYRGRPPEYDSLSVVKTMQTAALAFDPRSSSNSFTPVLTAMSKDPNHSGWQYMLALHERYDHLPLATFEAWKALIKHPQAFAMSLFVFEVDVELLDKIDLEFPLLWESVSVQSLKDACDHRKAALLEAGVDEESASEYMVDLLASLREIIRGFGESICCYINRQPIPAQAQLPHEVMKSVVINGWYQDLLKNAVESQWPEHAGEKLEVWYTANGLDVLGLTCDNTFRHDVIYLPVFLAAQACEVDLEHPLILDSPESIFFLKEIQNFDSTWFNSLYRHSLFYFINLDQ